MYKKNARSQLDMKIHNLKLVFDEVRTKGPVSRTDLAKRTGMSATSMTRIVSCLSEMGLIHETTAQPAEEGIGRPAMLLDVQTEAGFCLCVDISSELCKLAVADLHNHFIASYELQICAADAFPSIVDRIVEALPALIQKAQIRREWLLACGVSIAAHVQNDTGVIYASAGRHWSNVNVILEMEQRLHLPTIVENDCKAALIGEAELLSRAGKNPTGNVAYLQLGFSGVGGAVMLENRLFRGSLNAAGEIGHMTVEPDGEICNCSRRGCFETVLTERYILKAAQRANPALDTMEKIMQALKDGDSDITAIIDRIGDYIAIAVNNISCAYNPDVIILNGPLLLMCPQCFEAAKKHLAHRFLSSINPNIVITMAEMGMDAGLFGVDCMAIEQMVHSLLHYGCTIKRPS